MPIICIGPVCIPIAALIPLLLFIFKPIYDRLPITQQQKIDGWIQTSQLALNAFFRKIGWYSKPKKDSKSSTDSQNSKTTENSMTTSDSRDDKTEEKSIIIELENNDVWNELILKTKQNSDFIFVAYFTADDCEPCKKIFPAFETLALDVKNNDECLMDIEFIKVDVGLFESLEISCKILMLPTFVLFKNGVQFESIAGPNEKTLGTFFEENIFPLFLK